VPDSHGKPRCRWSFFAGSLRPDINRPSGALLIDCDALRSGFASHLTQKNRFVAATDPSTSSDPDGTLRCVLMAGGGAVEVLEPGVRTSDRVHASRRRPALADCRVQQRLQQAARQRAAVQTSQPPAAQQRSCTPTVDARPSTHISE